MGKKQLYYVADNIQTATGLCVIWHKIGGGFTCKLDEARTFNICEIREWGGCLQLA